MKGVVVQVGSPKSIVLFNNGKIAAIPTPEEAHVGMVVQVKLNNRPKIIAAVLAALILLATGIGIGFLLQRTNAHGEHREQTGVEKFSNSDYSFQKGKEEHK